jgi:hypothetical protein
MEMIKELQIRNYKSIKQLDLSCNRINVLIGEPNVGKSNILEALDLSYLSWLFNSNEDFEKNGHRPINLKEYFRVNKVADLFHLGDISKPIEINHPGFYFDVSIKYNKKEDKRIFEWVKSDGQITSFNNDFEPIAGTLYYGSPIKPYRFKENIEFHDAGNYIDQLMPPYGNNFIEFIKYNRDYSNFLGKLIKGFGLELNVDARSREIQFQMRLNEGLVYTVGYDSIADTLRRLFFYLAAK